MKKRKTGKAKRGGSEGNAVGVAGADLMSVMRSERPGRAEVLTEKASERLLL